MERVPVIAIFDVGKTNKKVFLFDEDYQIVFHDATVLAETKDEDGFPCEDIEKLTQWLHQSFAKLQQQTQFEIKAINFSGYGASFVYVDENGKPIAPLYNYLKSYPEDLKKQFYDTYGGEEKLCLQTASPALENLNSGLQLYRIKHQKPGLFKQIKYALHLPQYLSSVFSGEMFSDITSIGCHTALWDFERNDYHRWVYGEHIAEKLAPIKPADTVIPRKGLKTGIGIHDSSAALIPYLKNFEGSFVLLSTGTWSISLNPFNQSRLTAEDLKNDCLNYIAYDDKPVKASRFFIGHIYDEGVKRIVNDYSVDAAVFRDLNYQIETENLSAHVRAYYGLMKDIVGQQKKSTAYVLQDNEAKRLFVDGGFSRNKVFMHLLAEAFPRTEVCAASMAEGSALGAALAIHQHWNAKPISEKLIALKKVHKP